MPHPIAKAIHHDARVIEKSIDCFSDDPPAFLLDLDRHIPMMQAHPRLDACRNKRVDEPVVKAKTLAVDRPGAGGEHARP
jgi:hypothetical protein